MSIDTPFRIEVDVSVSTFECHSHGPHRCFSVICPGDLCYQKTPPGERYSFTLCGRCGALAIRELRQFVREALLKAARPIITQASESPPAP